MRKENDKKGRELRVLERENERLQEQLRKEHERIVCLEKREKEVDEVELRERMRKEVRMRLEIEDEEKK